MRNVVISACALIAGCATGGAPPPASEAGTNSIGAPTATAMVTAMTPTVSEMRPPCSTRLATSRPSWSLPSQYAPPGGCNAVRGAVRIGSRGLTHGAPTAMSASSPRITRPTIAPR